MLEVEAGPTVLADGIEKDIALVVAPSVTLPCPERAADAAPDADALPPLFNVAALIPGPFTVTIPVVASYAELTGALSVAFTDGKLFFSADYPQLYVEKPELYESQAALVLKLHIAGPVRKLGIDSDLDGNLYLVGHPAVVDNELRLPDLRARRDRDAELLLSLKAMTDANRIRDQARAALRLDIGDRLRDARAKVGSNLTFGTPQGCFRGDVNRIEVTGVHPHAAYLRVSVEVTARARLEMPCSSPATSELSPVAQRGSGPAPASLRYPTPAPHDVPRLLLLSPSDRSFQSWIRSRPCQPSRARRHPHPRRTEVCGPARVGHLLRRFDGVRSGRKPHLCVLRRPAYQPWNSRAGFCSSASAST